MTVAVADAPGAIRSAPRSSAYRFELVKLLSQWRIRLVVAVCWVAPALFIAAVNQQSSLPVDTVFGRWMHATGWAAPLVVLGFSGTWALPLLTSLVAGDVFATEDRLGTWRHLLVAVRSPRRIFLAKSAASLTVVLVMVLGLACASAAAGLAVVGNQPLVGLDGALLEPGDAARLVALAWLCVVPPTLALAAVGLLGSVALGRSPIGLLLPALLALAMQLAQLLPIPLALRLALPGYAFVGWRGLFTQPAQTQPLLIGLAVSLAWAAAATLLARRLFLRRDFTDLGYDGSGRNAVTGGLLPLAALLSATAVSLALTVGAGSGVAQVSVQRSVATTFAQLYVLQTRQLHRPDVTVAGLRTAASCARGGRLAADSGPGNDWRCVVSWRLPGVRPRAYAVYQLDVFADGRYLADGDGPKQVNGFFQVRTPVGDAPNPLWQFDGSVGLLSHPPKG